MDGGDDHGDRCPGTKVAALHPDSPGRRQDRLQSHEQGGVLERLDDPVRSTELHRVHGCGAAVDAGHEHHFGLAAGPVEDVAEDLEPVRAGQEQVEKDDVDSALLELPKRSGATDRGDDLVIVLEHQAERLVDALVVVDHEDEGRRRALSCIAASLIAAATEMSQSGKPRCPAQPSRIPPRSVAIAARARRVWSGP
jgi:hypothetical protein